MKKILIVIACLTLVIGISSCTDAGFSKMRSFGNEHKVELYSGGIKIGEWIASGKVISEENSDGYYFMDTKTNLLMEVSGDVVITRLEGKDNALNGVVK